MEKYKRTEEVAVYQWLGDKALIDEINEMLKPFNYSDFVLEVGISTDENILYTSVQKGEFTSNDYVRFGQYIIFDINNEDRPLVCYDEERLNEKYTKI